MYFKHTFLKVFVKVFCIIFCPVIRTRNQNLIKRLSMTIFKSYAQYHVYYFTDIVLEMNVTDTKHFIKYICVPVPGFVFIYKVKCLD